jgi:ParB-like chromosome segregation protein Spo0J
LCLASHPHIEDLAGQRYRKVLGDIEPLAASIADIGMLHPIVVTADNKLIAGERRIAAAKSLGWKTVPVRVIDIDAVVLGEHAENELRKDFTVSERVEIGAEVEKKLGERQGERNDLAEISAKSGKTADLAGEKAGFGSGDTYLFAKTVVENGSPDLVAAVDAGEISISAGAAIAELPKPEQDAIVKAGPSNVVEAAKAVKAKRKAAGKEKRAAAKVRVLDQVYQMGHLDPNAILRFPIR